MLILRCVAAYKTLSLWRAAVHITAAMQFHASCAAREGYGVLLLGPSGSGKSNLLLRLLDHGFSLVADDRVDLMDGTASPPPALAGLLEVRGLGLICLPYIPSALVVLAVEMGLGDRLPYPAMHALCDQPLVRIDPTCPAAVQRVSLALNCVLGRVRQIAGAFA